MSKQAFLNYNGKIYRAGKLLISPDNRSFRYGDGCFETIRMINRKIILEAEHFERLFSSIELLKFEKPDFFTTTFLKEQMIQLTQKNLHDKDARIRLTIFRGDGGLYDAENNIPGFIIQSWPLNAENTALNRTGLVLDIFPDARKASDNFSHIKSNNFLPYVMAALWARKNDLNDALVLNVYQRIADATIANVFMVKDGIVKTPALTEGCIGGVMRKYLLRCLRKEGIPAEETQVSVDDVKEASEIFLTNAVNGIRWVRKCGGSHYRLQLTSLLYKKFIEPLFC